MKRSLVSLLIFGAFLFGITASSLNASPARTSIDFGNRTSGIKVSDGAKLNISSSHLTFDGTLIEEDGSTITGEAINFDGGKWERDGIEATLTGRYVPGDDVVLQMTGNDRFDFEPGSVVHGISVDGADNTIEGQPTFGDVITLADEDTELTLAIQSGLNKNLELNGGTLTLGDDLRLNDNVIIVGPGTVDLDGRQLTLGGYYSSSNGWGTDLTFENATSIYLTGNIALADTTTGTWRFATTARINGNGETLDLSDGGRLVINAGEKLYLEDIIIKGIGSVGLTNPGIAGGDRAGAIVFKDTDSELYLSNVTLVFDNDVTYTQGNVHVTGDSTFVLRGNNVTFSDDARLTVSYAVLWLEALDREEFAHFGTLLAPNATYDSHGYSAANVTLNTGAAGNLTFEGNGIVKETTEMASGVPSVDAQIFSGDVHDDVTLNRNLVAQPGQEIVITDNETTHTVTIDGNNCAITFSNSTSPQLFVAAGCTLILKNIELANLSNNTISIGVGAHIIFQEDVILKLAESVTFSSNDKDNTTALLTVATDGVLTIIGQGSKKTVTFDSPYTGNNDQKSIELGSNELILENVECTGLDAWLRVFGVDTRTSGGLTLTDDNEDNPTILLMGNATLNMLGKTKTASSQPLTPAYDITASGQDNSLVFMRDSILFRGTLNFGSDAINAVHVKCAFSEAQDINESLSVRTALGVATGVPLIALNDNAFYVYSESGTAQLFFDDPTVAIHNVGSNSFSVNAGGELKGKTITLFGDPIAQLANSAIIDISNLVGTIDTSASRSFKPRTHKTIERAFEEELACALEEGATRKIGTSEDTVIFDSSRERTRAIASAIPTSYNQQFRDIKIETTDISAGNILVQRATLDEFLVATADDLALVMNGLSEVYLPQTSAVTLRGATTTVAPQRIVVQGKGNKLYVYNTLTLGKNSLVLSEGAELTVEFVKYGSSTPTINFSGNDMNIAKNATLQFNGNGSVVLASGANLVLGGTNAYTMKTEAETVTNQPTLKFSGGAVLDVASGVTASIQGIGRVEVSDGGKIAPASGTLVFGKTSATVGSHNIDLVVTRGGMIKLEPTTGSSVVSFRCVNANISFAQGGTLSVGTGGSFELNRDGNTIGTTLSGRINLLSFDNGNLVTKGTGKLLFASNRTPAGYTYINTAGNSRIEFPLVWKGLGSRATGAGTLESRKKDGTVDASGTLSPTNASAVDTTYNATTTLGGVFKQLVNAIKA